MKRDMYTRLMMGIGLPVTIISGIYYFQPSTPVLSWSLVFFTLGAVLLFIGMDLRYKKYE